MDGYLLSPSLLNYGERSRWMAIKRLELMLLSELGWVTMNVGRANKWERCFLASWGRGSGQEVLLMLSDQCLWLMVIFSGWP